MKASVPRLDMRTSLTSTACRLLVLVFDHQPRGLDRAVWTEGQTERLVRQSGGSDRAVGQTERSGQWLVRRPQTAVGQTERLVRRPQTAVGQTERWVRRPQTAVGQTASDRAVGQTASDRAVWTERSGQSGLNSCNKGLC